MMKILYYCATFLQFIVTTLLLLYVAQQFFPNQPIGLLLVPIGALIFLPMIPYADLLEKYKRWHLQYALKKRKSIAEHSGHTAIWVTPEVLATLQDCHAGDLLDKPLLKTVIAQIKHDIKTNQTQQDQLAEAQLQSEGWNHKKWYDMNVRMNQLTTSAGFYQQVLDIATRALNGEKLALLTAQDHPPFLINAQCKDSGQTNPLHS